MLASLGSIILSLALLSVHCDVYFKEEFETASKWTKSNKGTDLGEMKLSKRQGSSDDSAQGFKTTQDSRFYHYSAPLEKAFPTVGKDVVFEFSLRHEQALSCGGGYVKLLLDDYGKKFSGDSEYAIMFGPDACGVERRIHLIFSHDGKNVLRTSDIDYKLDTKLHAYSLIVKKDKSYNVLVDGVSVAHGKIVEDFELFGPPEIDDPKDVKPDDWVENSQISDPDAKKPEDWDQPEFITDTEATKPEDWDDKDDGEWTPPTKSNPDYKGEWSAPMIDNPDYKGPFVPKKIPNPDYKVVDTYCEYVIKGVGIDLWQVQSGSVFDRILLTDDLDEAEAFRKESVRILTEENKANEKTEAEESKTDDEDDGKEEEGKEDEL